jgi:UDP-2,4-diacetamido-2,4,6-trideoxy-beta-L-altropyranose hydrolase
MLVAIRADASLEIGTGHVMRCLTLAGLLRERGARNCFICREQPGNLCAAIEERGFQVRRLSLDGEAEHSWHRDADESRTAIESLGERPGLLVVDHYGLDERWERSLRSRVGRILVLDDLADRHHDCDVLLDQNLHDAPESRYAGRVGEHTRVFVGPQYALLRPEFDQVAPGVRDRGLHRLLVFFGGVDPSNEALKVVLALRSLEPHGLRVTVVLGPVSPHAASVSAAAAGSEGIELLGATREMAALMAQADLAIGTCGGSAWERCALGLPSLVVVSADNQRDDARILHARGAVRSLGDAAVMTVDRWAAEIDNLRHDPQALAKLSQASMNVMSGRKDALRELEGALGYP